MSLALTGGSSWGLNKKVLAAELLLRAVFRAPVEDAQFGPERRQTRIRLRLLQFVFSRPTLAACLTLVWVLPLHLVSCLIEDYDGLGGVLNFFLF